MRYTQVAEGVDEAADEPTVLLVNWPNFVGPCIHCSRNKRVRVIDHEHQADGEE